MASTVGGGHRGGARKTYTYLAYGRTASSAGFFWSAALRIHVPCIRADGFQCGIFLVGCAQN